MKRTNENTLSMYWSKAHKDIVYRQPYTAATPDSRLLHYTFACPRQSLDAHEPLGVSFADDVFTDLEKRGYDLTTLRFSICKKAVAEPKAKRSKSK